MEDSYLNYGEGSPYTKGDGSSGGGGSSNGGGNPGGGPGGPDNTTTPVVDSSDDLRRRKLRLADHLQNIYDSEFAKRVAEAPDKNPSYVRPLTCRELGLDFTKRNPSLNGTTAFDAFLLQLKNDNPGLFPRNKPGTTPGLNFIE